MTQELTMEKSTAAPDPDGDSGKASGPSLADIGLQTKSERTRQRILESAARIFRQQGYGARLSDIAAEAGMQAGSLYYHFDGRESLVADVLRKGIESAWGIVREALAEMPPEATALDRLEAAIRAHTLAVLEMSDYTAANSRIYPMASETVRREHHTFQRAYGEFFHELFVAAVESGELRDDLDLPIVRMLLFGAMNWTAEWFRPGRSRTPQHIADQLLALGLQGLVTDPCRAASIQARATPSD